MLLGTLSCNRIEVKLMVHLVCCIYLVLIKDAYSSSLLHHWEAKLTMALFSIVLLDLLLKLTIALFSNMLLDPLLLMLRNGPWMTTRKLNSKGNQRKAMELSPPLPSIRDKKESNWLWRKWDKKKRGDQNPSCKGTF